MHSTFEKQDADTEPRTPVRRVTQRPVFVDGSGKRPRRARRVGRLLLLPAAGYLALLVSTALGGPTVHAPFLPLPQDKPTPTAPARPAAPGPGRPAATLLPSSGHSSAHRSRQPTPGHSRTRSDPPTPRHTRAPSSKPTATASSHASPPVTVPTPTGSGGTALNNLPGDGQP